MIVTCQKCTKKYQLTEDKIPEDGLQVRCANCGFTWLVKNSSPETPSEQPFSPETFEDSSHETTSTLATIESPQPGISSEVSSTSPLAKPPSFLQRIKFDWIVLGLGVSTLVLILLLDYLYNPVVFEGFLHQRTNNIHGIKQPQEVEPDTPIYQAKNVPYRPDEPGVSKYDK